MDIRMRKKSKQGKAKFFTGKRCGHIDVSFIDKETLTVKTKKDGLFKVNAKLVSKPVIGIRSLGEKKEIQVAKAVQELVSKRLVKQEGFIDFQINGGKLRRPADGVWPPYRVSVKNGIVIDVVRTKK